MRLRPYSPALLRGQVIVAGLLGASATCPYLYGQDRPRIWLGAGLGSAGGREVEGAAGMGELVYQTGPHHFAIRGLIAGDPFGDDVPFGEVGVLYGRSAKRKWGHSAIAAGLAWTNFGPCTGTGTDCTTMGIPVVGEIAARLFSIAGVGLQGFVNLNTKSIYRGAVLFLQLGWLPAGER
jgi:hypothetical protein